MSNENLQSGAGASSPQFEVSPYQAEGGFSMSGAFIMLGMVLAAGAVLGFAASFVSSYFYLILLFPCAIACGVGFVGNVGVWIGKMRSPLLGGFIGLLGGCAAMLSMHYFDYQQFLSKARELPPEIRDIVDFDKVSFIDYMEAQAEQGVEVKFGRGGKDKNGFNLGYVGSIIYWIVEVLIVAVIAFCFTAGRSAEPYCNQCHTWKNKRVFGPFFVDNETAVSILYSGEVSKLVDIVSFSEPAVSKPSCVLNVADCRSCAEDSPLDVQLSLITKNDKGEAEETELIHCTYPGRALKVFEHIFTPRV